MPNGSSDPVWTELGNIDYFLEHLAHAVERGDVDRAAYDAVAPRYLERRADLVSILEARVARTRPAPSIMTGPTPTPQAQSSTAAQPAARPAYEPITQPRREPVQVNWTAVLTGVGALLVIVASAIFAIATWKSFSVGFRIGFLGILTAGFYLAGNLVRTRLRLAGGGVALMVVGSAMLLFDGWIVIDGYDLAGPWPWVAWLAVCSAVYWITEVRVAGRFFGAIGAAAQIAWVWLLGQGLGWETGPRMAGVAAVALAWTLAGRLAEERKPLESLSWVLRLAGPVVVMLSAVVAAVDLGIAPVGWPQVISALVIGACATAIADLAGLPSGAAAITHMPAFFAIASMVSNTLVPGWGHVIVLALMAVAYLVYEVVRGGWGHGALALLAEAGAWRVLSLHYAWKDDVTVAVFAAVAVSWLLAATLIERTENATWRGARSTRLLAAGGGYALLAVATMGVPLARATLPLAGMPIAARDVKLAAFVAVAWWVVSAIRDEPGAGVMAIAGLFYTTAAVLAWTVPEWHSALYATALLAESGGVLAARKPLGSILKLPDVGIAVGMRIIALTTLLVGLIATEYYGDLRAWQTVVLVATCAVFWVFDALFAEEFRLGLGVSSMLAVAAAALLCWVRVPVAHAEYAAIAGGGAALLLAGTAALVPRSKGWSDVWILGAAVAGTACCLATLSDSGIMAIALALASLTWIAVAYALMSEAAAVSTGLAMLALVSLLAHFDGKPWITVASMLAASAVFFAPSLIRLDERKQRARRAVRAMAVAGISGPALLIVFGTPYSLGIPFGVWAQIGEQGIAVALFGLGVYAVAGGIVYRFEPAIYAGGAAFVAAVWAELTAFDIGQIAAFTTPLALFLVWAGIWTARRTDELPNPAFDLAAALVALVPASLAAVSSAFAGAALPELVWALGLALAAIGLGIVLKVRAYLFGGSAALVFVAVGRSWVYLVELWWLVLGLIGIAMLVIAIAWGREQTLAEDARRRVSATFEGWR